MAITLEKRNPVNVILIAVLLFVSAAAGYFYWNSNEAVKSRDAMSVRMHYLEEEKVKVSAELEKSKSELGDYQKKLEDLTKEVAESKKTQQISEADLKRKTEEMSDLQKRYEKRIQELENEVKQYADFNMMLTKALEPIKAALVHPGTAASSLVLGSNSPSASLPNPTVFSVPTAVKSDTSVELAAGQVLSIDKEYGFLVVNFGSANGVHAGGIVEIYHQDESLGIGQVERVQDKISAVSIVSEDLRARVQSGDRAVLIS